MRGSPMGVLLIAAGVLLLNLAYSGRGSAVWTALTSGSGNAAATGENSTPPTDPATAAQNDPITGLTVQQAANAAAIGINAGTTKKVFALQQGAACPSTHWTVRAASGDTFCALKGDASVAHWNDEHKSCGSQMITGTAMTNTGGRGICIALPGSNVANGAGQAITTNQRNVTPSPLGGYLTRYAPNVPAAGWAVE